LDRVKPISDVKSSKKETARAARSVGRSVSSQMALSASARVFQPFAMTKSGLAHMTIMAVLVATRAIRFIVALSIFTSQQLNYSTRVQSSLADVPMWSVRAVMAVNGSVRAREAVWQQETSH
jgi:hypothetical protein